MVVGAGISLLEILIIYIFCHSAVILNIGEISYILRWLSIPIQNFLLFLRMQNLFLEELILYL